MPAPIITTCNNKRGVGRSTLLFHLARSLAQRGLRTLIVDLDPQSSLTYILLGPDARRNLRPDQVAAALLDPWTPPMADTITRRTRFSAVNLIPNSHTCPAFLHPTPQLTGALQFARNVIVPMR
jgi:cellulose biosynthesis protein BcsQ